MSFETLDQLESKVQMVIDNISLMQLEIEELKEKNNSLQNELYRAQETQAILEEENNKLRAEHEVWQQRIRSLLGKIEDVE